MTSPNASALPLPGGAAARRRPTAADARSLAGERLEARRRRIRAIRQSVVALAVTLFVALQVVIFRASATTTTASSGVAAAQTSSSSSSHARTRASGSAASTSGSAGTSSTGTSNNATASAVSTSQS